MRGATHALIYSSQCPNCARFIDALRRTSVASEVSLVEVASLTSEQRDRVTAVPTLALADGPLLTGTKAFEWLKQYEGDVALESFSGTGSLPFSAVDHPTGYAMYSESFSAFEPVA